MGTDAKGIPNPMTDEPTIDIHSCLQKVNKIT